jgi:hypothetical protein
VYLSLAVSQPQGLISADAQIAAFDHFSFDAFMNYVAVSVRDDRTANPCCIMDHCSISSEQDLID